jgi:plastocyanin
MSFNYILCKAGITSVIFLILFFSLILLPQTEGGAEDRPGSVVISIVENAAGLCDKAFSPPEVTVPVGATVVWVNKDIVTHTLVSGSGEDPCSLTPLPVEDRMIEAGQILQGKSYQMTFDAPGVYPYTCHLPTHRMRGKVIVVSK